VLWVASDAAAPAGAAPGAPAVLRVVDGTGPDGLAGVQVQAPGSPALICDDGFNPVDFDTPGEACRFALRQGDAVTLTALATDPVRFRGWSDDRCPAGPVPTCTLVLEDAQTVVALFSPVTVSVHPTGVHGTSTVKIDDAAGHTCTAIDGGDVNTCTFDLFSTLTLVATAGESKDQPVWNERDCSLVPDGVQLVEACTATLLGGQQFNIGFGEPPPEDQPPKVDVIFRARTTGSGSGTIRGDLDCGSRCSVTKPFREPVTLVAAPAAGSRFVRWSGGCGTVTTCTLQAIATSVSAEFEPLPDSVSRNGPSSLKPKLGGPFKALLGTIATVGHRDGRQIRIPIGVNAPAGVRVRLVKKGRTVKSRLFSLQAGVSLMSLGVPKRAHAGRYRLKITIRDRRGSPPIRIARSTSVPA